MAVAQSVDLSSLEICAHLETAELKLACFEAIIAAHKSAGEQLSEITVQRAPDSAPAATVPEIAATTGPENGPETSELAAVIAVAPGNDAATTEPELVVAESQVAPETTPAVSATQTDEQYRREQPATADQEEKKEVIKATVVDVTQGHNKTLYFHLASGQVWRQIESRHLQYPKDREFEIDITQGVMGEYRMRIGDTGRMVGIRRIK